MTTQKSSYLKKFKEKKLGILLVFVLLIAGIFRIYRLDSNPIGFFCDEASVGYDAHLIGTTGRDQHGSFMPFFFQSFGDYKPGIPVYISVPFNIFGFNEFTSRLPFALCGIALVLLFYYFGKEVKSSQYGILASLIAAISPWTIHYSRVAFEIITFPTLLLFSFLLFFKSEKKPFFIPYAFLTLSLTFYTYRASFLQTPLIFLFMMFVFRKKLLKFKRLCLLGITAFFITSIPFIVSLIDGRSLQRAHDLSLGNSLTFIQKTITILSVYFHHFSYEFLFSNGDNFFVTRHFIEKFPPLSIVFIPFLLLGVYSILKKRDRFTLFILFLLFIYPLPGSLTKEPPYTSRSILGVIPFILLVAEGLYFVFMYKNKKTIVFKSVSILFILVSMVQFFRFYFYEYPIVSSDFWGWQYGARDIVKYFVAHENEYDQLIMAPEFNAPDIFFKFYAPNNCTNCVLGLPESHYIPSAKQIYAVTPSYVTTHPQFKILEKKKLFYPNGSVAFIIGEVVQ